MVDRLDSIRIVHGKFRIVWCLSVEIIDSVANAKRIEYQLGAVSCAIGNRLVLIVEVVEEGWTIVTPIRFGPQVECLAFDVAVQLRKSAQEALEDMPSSNRRQIGRGELSSINHGIFAVDAITRVLMLAREWIESPCLLFGIREAYPERLRDEQQVRDLTPGVRVDGSLQIRGDIAGSKF